MSKLQGTKLSGIGIPPEMHVSPGAGVDFGGLLLALHVPCLGIVRTSVLLIITSYPLCQLSPGKGRASPPSLLLNVSH